MKLDKKHQYLEGAALADQPYLVGPRVHRPVGLDHGDDGVALAVDGLLGKDLHGRALVGLYRHVTSEKGSRGINMNVRALCLALCR